MDPTRYFCTDALMKAAQGWVLPWAKLTEQTLQGQARFMSAVAPTAAAQAPSPNQATGAQGVPAGRSGRDRVRRR
jgi:hypothetical protein